MQILDQLMLESTLTSLRVAWHQYRSLTVRQALSSIENIPPVQMALLDTKRAADTIYSDYALEAMLAFGDGNGGQVLEGHLQAGQRVFNDNVHVFTEELGHLVSEHLPQYLSKSAQSVPQMTDISNYVFHWDPLDGSKLVQDMLESPEATPGMVVGEVFDRFTYILQYYGGTLPQTGAPSSSVTFMNSQEMVYAAVMNLFTGEISVISDMGVFAAPIQDNYRLEDWIQEDNRVVFNPEEGRNIVCYYGKPKYTMNFDRLHLGEMSLRTNFTTGPNRWQYLREFPTGGTGIQGVVYNNESFRESGPSVLVAKVHPDIVSFELMHEGYISPFNEQGDSIDLNVLASQDPRESRANLVIFHKNNDMMYDALKKIEQYGDVQIRQLFR